MVYHIQDLKEAVKKLLEASKTIENTGVEVVNSIRYQKFWKAHQEAAAILKMVIATYKNSTDPMSGNDSGSANFLRQLRLITDNHTPMPFGRIAKFLNEDPEGFFAMPGAFSVLDDLILTGEADSDLRDIFHGEREARRRAISSMPWLPRLLVRMRIVRLVLNTPLGFGVKFNSTDLPKALRMRYEKALDLPVPKRAAFLQSQSCADLISKFSYQSKIK